MLTRRGVAWSLPAFCLGRSGSTLAQLAEPMTPSPADDYQKTAELLRAGRPDLATYWFYRAQLRARIHLLAHPELPPDGLPALLASYYDLLGRPVNQYAFGDIPALVAVMDRVLAWHDAYDDPFTPKRRYAAAHERIRAGLVGLRNQTLSEQDRIREQRRQNGLPNRS